MPHDGFVVTIGVFDGVHVGHRAILGQARQVAARCGGRVLAIVFEPHPASVLRPTAVPPQLVSRSDKENLLREAGADLVRFVQPTVALLDHSPRRFIQDLVAEERVLAIVEGPDFRFGKNRQGDVALLRRLGASLGFEACIVESVTLALHDQLIVTVHSSLIRWLLAAGRVADAARCLGRAFTLCGTVVRGEGRGREIGVPTANLSGHAAESPMLPADGVYLAHAVLEDQRTFPAAVSVGCKSTFAGDGERVVEAHLLDFGGDLYGRPLQLQFIRWLRDQVRFDGVEALKAQIASDIMAVRRLADGARCSGKPGPGTSDVVVADRMASS